MQDKSIDGALLALRKQIIRDDAQRLMYVEAVLALRGVHTPAVLPAKRKDVAGKGMSVIILEALNDGPLHMRSIVPMLRLGVLSWNTLLPTDEHHLR